MESAKTKPLYVVIVGNESANTYTAPEPEMVFVSWYVIAVLFIL